MATRKLIKFNKAATTAVKLGGQFLTRPGISKSALRVLPCIAVTFWKGGTKTVSPTFKFATKTGLSYR